MSLQSCLATVLLTFLGVGCGSDDKKSSVGDAVSSCNAYCDKAGTSCASEDAGALFEDATDCKHGECEGIPTASECQAPIKAYFDCLNKTADPCNLAACSDEFYAEPISCQ